ncbi:MAG: polysaccharide deacetylase family protein [Rhodospirillaceae bacterium]|nr:polysaccharide deacetylase family protein [Rhodospirillaceae bacterium]
MTGWDELCRELDLWATRGEAPALWWRDDDAVEPSAALERTMALAEAAAVPLALAVIPAANRLTAADLSDPVTAVQHGYAHRNHAGPKAKKCELGAERRADHVIAELMTGRHVLEQSFGDSFRPVLVPPWNRLGAHLPAMLPELGYIGLSRFGARDRPAIGAMRIANAHVDIIDWKGSRGFVGTETALARTVGHLRARREGAADPAEATGLLTHHRVHDAGCWDFLEKLFAVTAGSGLAKWRSATSLF